jgi:cell division protein ZapA
MSEEATRVQVDIAGRTYTLMGGRDPRLVKDLAAFVDRRIAEIAARTTTADTARLAILAAINIADELFQARDGSREFVASGDPAARDQRLCRILDEALSG